MSHQVKPNKVDLKCQTDFIDIAALQHTKLSSQFSFSEIATQVIRDNQVVEEILLKYFPEYYTSPAGFFRVGNTLFFDDGGYNNLPSHTGGPLPLFIAQATRTTARAASIEILAYLAYKIRIQDALDALMNLELWRTYYEVPEMDFHDMEVVQ